MGLLDRFKSLFDSGRVDLSKRFAMHREAISGTMSKFYVAKDLKSGKIVGVKILDLEKTAAFEARFKGANKPGEGEIGMRLKHPRLVETLEYGTTVDGKHYVVLEYLEGADFNSLVVARDPCLVTHRTRYIRQAAEALGAVHAAGFIHRDISPRNYMLVKKGGADLKLIDFGLTVPATAMFMQPGIRTGNPNYMAPEVVRRKPTDQRIDVFAFGVTAYELIALGLPWLKGTTGMAAMSHDQAPPDLRQRCADVHPALAKAIHWCLEAEPTKRCPSMEKFLHAIREVKE